VVDSVQISVRRYLLIAGGLLLRAAVSVRICRNVAPCCDGVSTRVNTHLIA
jgi:hypothetical protein